MRVNAGAPMRIGFIGLGRMGQAIAARVLANGHDLVLYNRTPAKCEALAREGATVSGDIASACASREIVITVLADDAALEEVVLGAGGVRDSLPAGGIHICMGTHGVGAVRALAEAHAEAGQTLVGAPVLGRPELANEGRLGIVTGGPDEAVERCGELFAQIGRRAFHAGPKPESAAAIKLANNLVLGCAIEVLGEAFALVRLYDVEPALFYEVLTDGLFSGSAHVIYGQLIAEQDFDRVGITASLGLKDANLALAAGDIARMPLPSVSVWRDRLLSAIAHGNGDKDWAVVALEQSRAGGLDRAD